MAKQNPTNGNPATATYAIAIKAGENDKAFAATPLNGVKINFVQPTGNDLDAVRLAVESGAFKDVRALLSAAYGVRRSRIVAEIKRKAVGKDGDEPEIADAAAAQAHADSYKMTASRTPNGEVPESTRRKWDKLAKDLSGAIASGVFGPDQLTALADTGQLAPEFVAEQIAKLRGA